MQTGYRTTVCILTISVLLQVMTARADVEQIESSPTHTRIEVSEFSETDRRRASAWHLNEEEWRRYDTLLKGIRGSVSPATLSPIEVLGIHARDNAERRRYAERWARAMRDDAERILAFQRAYDSAARRLFGDQDLIDINRLAGRTTAIEWPVLAQKRPPVAAMPPDGRRPRFCRVGKLDHRFMEAMVY